MPINSPDVFDSIGDAIVTGGGGGGGGSTTFLGLTDTPSSYSGQAGKVVKVNSGETALIFEDASGMVTPISSAYDSVASMVAATDISNGDTVATEGYYSLSDGGEMLYTVTNTDLSASVDGGSVIALAGSLYAQAQFPPFYRPEMWGAKDDNSTASATTNVTAFTNLFAYMVSNNKPVELNSGTYYLNNSVPMLAPLPFDANYADGFYVIKGNGATLRSTGRSTSTSTSLTFDTGVKTMTVGSGQGFVPGDKVCISYSGNRMMAVVNSYSGTTLVANVYQVDGYELMQYRSSSFDFNIVPGTTSTVSLQNGHLFQAGQQIRVTSDFEIDALATINSKGGTSMNVTTNSNSSTTYTSTTSRTVASSGTFSFAVGVNMARKMLVGARMKATSTVDPTATISGTYSYTGGSPTNIVIIADASTGSGTFNSWTIEVEEVGNYILKVQPGFTHNNWTVKGGITMLDRSVGVRTTSANTFRPTFTTASNASFATSSGSITFFANDPVISTDVTGYKVFIERPRGGFANATGIVTSYNTTTGETTANITSVNSPSTRSDWGIQFSKTLGNTQASFSLSTTSLTLRTGSGINLTVTPFGFDVTGYWVNIMYKSGSSTGNSSEYDKCMWGTITSYTDATGAMTVTTAGNNTSATYSSWVVMAYPVDPTQTFTFDDVIQQDLANYSVFFEGAKGDFFGSPPLGADAKNNASIFANGYLLGYNQSTGEATALLNSAGGNIDWTYWTVVLRGENRDSSFISDRSIGSKYDISDIKFQGQGDTSFDIGLKYSNSYGSSLRRCVFNSLQIGYYGLFNLMGSIEDNNLLSCGWGIWGTEGDWQGGATQSNVHYLRNNRWFGGTSNLGGIRVTKSNAWTVEKYIHEGNASRHGIFVDARYDTTVKNFALDFLHLEVQLWRSFLFVPEGGQINKITFNNNFSQFKNCDYEGTTSNFFYNKIFNVATSIVKLSNGTGGHIERMSVIGEQNAFDHTNDDSYFINQLPFYCTGTSLSSLGIIDGGRKVDIKTQENGSTNGFLTVGRAAQFYGAYQTLLGATSSIGGIGTWIRGGSHGYFRAYVNQGAEVVSTAVQGVKIRVERAGGALIRFQQTGTSSAGAEARRIMAEDVDTSTKLWELPMHQGSTGQIWKLDASSGTPYMEWDYVYGQLVALQNSTATATVAINSGSYRAHGVKVDFTATATTMIFEVEALIKVAASETVECALSTDGTTFTDIGSTSVQLIINSASDVVTTFNKTWVVSGLTKGNNYELFPYYKSSGTSSEVRSGNNVSPFIIKVKHGAQ